MIFAGPVPRANQKTSQKNYNLYCLVNGLSYMCLGETVLILLAVKIKSPAYVISTLGAMLYLGFLLLPLGKVRCAKIGAALSLADFWVARNVAAMIVAGGAVLAVFGMRIAAMVLLLVGAFLFYGFRAAGVVLSQPLLGTITNDDDRARFLGISNGLFYSACVVALLAISWLLSWNSGLWCLIGVVIAGAAIGVFSSTFLRKIDENAELQKSSKKTITPELRGAWANRCFVKQLLAGFVINLSLVMVSPLSIAALKSGYGISDAAALMYSLLQFASCSVMSFFCGRLNTWIGPRKSMLLGFGEVLLAAFCWFTAPDAPELWRNLLIFFLIGGAGVILNNAMVNYYLQTIAIGKQVAYSIIVAIVTNVGAGLAGMFLAGALLWFFVDASGDAAAILAGYRRYFGVAFLFLLPGIASIWVLTPLSSEQRKKANLMQIRH